MTIHTKNIRSTLLAGASLVVAGIAAPALASPPVYTDASVQATSSDSIGAVQQNGTFLPTPEPLVLSGNTQGSVNVTITNNDPATYALQGSTVTVGSSAKTGNTATATGFANSAGLTLDLTATNTLTGSGTATLSATGGSGSPAAVTATDDLGVHVSQANGGTAATLTNGTAMGVTVDHGASASTITVAGNTQTATGVLNQAADTFSAASVNASSASVGAASAQTAANSQVQATVQASDTANIGAMAATALSGSTLSIAGNGMTAMSVGNSASNTQSLTGSNDLALAAGDATSAATDAGGAYATGGLATVARQVVSGTMVGAAVDLTTPAIAATLGGDVSASTVHTDGNVLGAVAHANEAVNSTALGANSIVTGMEIAPVSGSVAAIASRQSLEDTNTVTASVAGGTGNSPAVFNAIAGSVANSSTVTASNNAITANADGNLASSGIIASATSIGTAGEAQPSAVNTGSAATAASAAFAVANQQSIYVGTTITANLTNNAAEPTGGASVTTAITGNVTDSAVSANGNQLTASATGNGSLSTGNTIALGGTNLATSAAVSSVQYMKGDVNAVVGSPGTAATPPSNGSYLFVGESSPVAGLWVFSGAAPGTQADVAPLQAAYPNATFSYSAGTIFVTVPALPAPFDVFPAAFSIPGSPATPATGGVIVTVGGGITNSTVGVNANTTVGSVIGNSVVNGLTANPTTALASGVVGGVPGTAGTMNSTENIASNADFVLANTQEMTEASHLQSQVGAQFAVSANGVGDPVGNVVASTVTVGGNDQKSSGTGNTATNSIVLASGAVSSSSALTNAQVMDGYVSAGTLPGSGAGVVIAGSITASNVAVNGNAMSGSTTGNFANNAISVTGAQSIGSSSFEPVALATPISIDDTVLAQADHSLANIQTLNLSGAGGGVLSTVVNGTYGITTLGTGAGAGASLVSGSTLSVSGNTQQAVSQGNLGQNSIALSGGSIATSGALQSVQLGNGRNGEGPALEAASTMTVGAPAASTNSTLALNNNSNTATATLNDATNVMTVTAANALMSKAEFSGVALLGIQAPLPFGTGNGDFVVNNLQFAISDPVTAQASTTITNTDMGGETPNPTVGVNGSTVAVNGNATLAAAIANRANNALNLSANSDTASGALVNQQLNGTSVAASAGSVIAVDVAGSNPGSPSAAASAVDTGGVSVNGNSTVARAGGNNATNVMNASATSFANQGAFSQTELGGGTGGSTAATFAILNAQDNGGAVSAAANVTYGASFNALGNAPTVAQSAVALNGNAVNAIAYGNAGTNTLTLSALNSPTPTTTSIATNQVNSGAITASSGSFGASIALSGTAAGTGNQGPVSQSSLSVNGNALGAAAYGNSVTNTLTVGGNAVVVGGRPPV